MITIPYLIVSNAVRKKTARRVSAPKAIPRFPDGIRFQKMFKSTNGRGHQARIYLTVYPVRSLYLPTYSPEQCGAAKSLGPLTILDYKTSYLPRASRTYHFEIDHAHRVYTCRHFSAACCCCCCCCRSRYVGTPPHPYWFRWIFSKEIKRFLLNM